MSIDRASYSPDDDKLRLYPVSRLDSETYARVKAAGFSWAPKQELFVAVWRPEREDLALELAGDIGDEDTGLVERAEERAERFGAYGERRLDEAESAKAEVDRIASAREPGQPVICGHHSEKRARRDAERVESGMRKAVKLWETSRYWEARAAGAIRHAKYKELPGVRHRRIKGLEADLRKYRKEIERSEHFRTRWSRADLTHEQALAIANYDSAIRTWSDLEAGTITAAEAAARCIAGHEAVIARYQRWAQHVELRLTYERAMLDEAGGIKAAAFDIQPGGRVLVGHEWFVVGKVNRSNGAVVSVSVVGPQFARVKPIERVSDYRPPTEEDVQALAKVSKRPPLVNSPTDLMGIPCYEMTKETWDRYVKSGVGMVQTAKGSEHWGAHRWRMRYVEHKPRQVFLTDAKVVPIPPPSTTTEPEPTIKREVLAVKPVARAPKPVDPHAEAFASLKDALKTGVRVVSAPQLFPTPTAIVEQMMEYADIRPWHRVLEPSAGTGNIVRELLKRTDVVLAVEIHPDLVKHLDTLAGPDRVHQGDFLAWTSKELGTFDRIVMNPPFAKGGDVAHIEHAATFLRPGGKLVALCANGPRQEAALRSRSSLWAPLLDGSFHEQGTGVRVVCLVIDAPAPVTLGTVHQAAWLDDV